MTLAEILFMWRYAIVNQSIISKLLLCVRMCVRACVRVCVYVYFACTFFMHQGLRQVMGQIKSKK